MKVIVIDKKHLTLVSHTNGVVIVEESGCIIDLDFQSLGSIFELADLGNTCTIKDCDEIETLKADNCKETVQYNELYNRNEYLEKKLTISQDSITALEESNVRYKEAIVDKDDIIKRQSGEIARLDKIIEEKTNSLIKLENIEDTASASRAIGDCRYYISLKDVLDKYENDIVDFNVSAMDIYYIHEASPNVVRKFNYDNFNTSCKDQRTANTINILLNCSNISVYDIMDSFKDDIAYSNTH